MGRQFMRWRSLAGIGLGILGAALVWKGYRNSKTLELRHEWIVIPDLPPQFEGFRILHLTDLHMRAGTTLGEELLAVIEEIDPDLVCMTGDYVYTSLSLPDIDTFFHGLSQRPAVVGVFGNADYREGITETCRANWSRFFPFLSNAAICLERENDCLWIAGVDDPHIGRDALLVALDQVPKDAPVILLAHSPEVIERPLDPRVRLILSGHTHGGQICLPGRHALYHNTSLPPCYSSGRHDVNGTTLYVSCGIGSTRLPLRYGCLPEITLFTLQQKGEGQPGKS